MKHVLLSVALLAAVLAVAQGPSVSDAGAAGGAGAELATETPSPTPTAPAPTPTLVPCAADIFEENDTEVAAALVLLPLTQSGLTVCPDDDDDWFEFSLLAGDTVQVDALFTDAEGDIDLTAFGPDGLFIDESASITDDEKMTFTALQSATYRVEVVLFQDFGSSEGNTYTLNVSLGDLFYGDANCSGGVNSIDASVILQLIAGLVTSIACEDAADVNLSGGVDSIDVTLILQFVAGLIEALPI